MVRRANPVNEYVFSRKIFTNQKKIEKLFSMVEFGCFQGHTHVAGCVHREPQFYDTR